MEGILLNHSSNKSCGNDKETQLKNRNKEIILILDQTWQINPNS